VYGPQFPLPTRLQKDHRTNTNDLPGGKISGEIELVKSLQEGFKYDANKKSVFLEKWASRASCEQRRKKGGVMFEALHLIGWGIVGAVILWLLWQLRAKPRDLGRKKQRPF